MISRGRGQSTESGSITRIHPGPDVLPHRSPVRPIANRGRQSVRPEMQLEVALYIESISAELRLMAKSAELEALAYFLEMARLEASIQVDGRAPSLVK